MTVIEKLMLVVLIFAGLLGIGRLVLWMLGR